MENSDVRKKLEEYNIRFLAKETEYGLRAKIDMSQAPVDRRLMIWETLDDFNAMETAFPNINTINIINCDGSSDDETNLLVSAKVHQKGMNTHILDNGDIASGGVDFFLAGVQRTQGTSTRIGVHSWAGGGNEATDFPVGDAEHQPYIDYYLSIDFTQQEAEDFYYFTINAAAAADIHWMTEAEIMQYGLITQ